MKVSNNRVYRYFQASFNELKKVTWPTNKEVINLTAMVAISVIIATVLVIGVDYVLTQAINTII